MVRQIGGGMRVFRRRGKSKKHLRREEGDEAVGVTMGLSHPAQDGKKMKAQLGCTSLECFEPRILSLRVTRFTPKPLRLVAMKRLRQRFKTKYIQISLSPCSELASPRPRSVGRESHAILIGGRRCNPADRRTPAVPIFVLLCSPCELLSATSTALSPRA